ncbi:MAG: signal peptidase I, partial [Ruthenibacterium sp.]
QNQQTDEAYEWCESIVFAIAFIITVLVFVIGFSRVSGESMVPTMQNGDHVLVQTIFYTPKRGDVITTDAWIDYAKPLAKRVIAIAGDTVVIDENGVSVNGTLLDEPYLAADTQTFAADITYPLTVPEGKVFVMGDNREHSLDGRSSSIGFIDARDILGKVLFRISPINRAGKIT